MTLWLPPADVDRVLRSMSRHLDAAALPPDLPYEGWVGGSAVTLPGFNLLEPVNAMWPLAWFVPSTVGLAQAVSLYEAYTTTRLGMTLTKPQQLAQAMQDDSLRLLLCREPRQHSDWFETGALLVALVAMFSDTPLKRTAHGVSTVCDAGTFRVSSTRMWSNTRYALSQVGQAAADFGAPALEIAPLLTDHPLAVTLVGLGAPVEALVAAHVAIAQESMPAGVALGRRAPVASAAPRAMGRPVIERRVTRDMAQEAYWHANHNRMGVVQELHRILVPHGMPSQRLRQLVGTDAYSEDPLTARRQTKVKAFLDGFM